MDTALINTELGSVAIEGNSSGIQAIRILNTVYPETAPIPLSLVPAVEQLREYLLGARKDFDLSLNPRGTEFQKKVWQCLREIPYGKTISYLDLSKKMGDSKAIRAVAAANGKNPVWIVIPCHRVIGSDGSMTGYAGGIHRKKWLLNLERGMVQTTLFDAQ